MPAYLSDAPPSLAQGNYGLGSMPNVPVIPPLLPNGEAIPLEPARFDPPSLAALRGDVNLPFIGQPPSEKSLDDIATDARTQRIWISIAVLALVIAVVVGSGLVVYAVH